MKNSKFILVERERDADNAARAARRYASSCPVLVFVKRAP